MSIRTGIIANPVSARDIRRITSYAAGLSLGERANMLLRMVQALAAAGADEVLLMPETEGLRRLAEQRLPAVAADCPYPLPRLAWLDMPVRNDTSDSVRAAQMMRDAGVPVIVVLGGDGTHRAVVKGCGRVPVAGVSTGTNNAFPPMREATLTAWAAGLFAAGAVPSETALKPCKCLHIRKFSAEGAEMLHETALVDAALFDEAVLGAKAIADTATLDAFAVTQASVEAVGLSAVAAALQPLGRREAGGLLVETAMPSENGFSVRAALAPGLIADVGIASCRRFAAGEVWRIGGRGGLIALDGEREIAFRTGERIEITLEQAAFDELDVPAVLAYAAAVRRRPFQTA